MTIDEYFGDWMKVIDRAEAMKMMGWLKSLNPNTLCPALPNVFRAFKLCPYNECRVVFVGQDPYPQKGVATGILFGNDNKTAEDKLSPSLQVIKEAVIDFGVPHNLITFDNSLESWAKQGILMINSALTCEVNKAGSHSIQWRAFVGKLLKNMSSLNNTIVYVLFGKEAQSFKPLISSSNNYILEENHPAYYARTGERMSGKIFHREINRIVKGIDNNPIEWFKEEQFNDEKDNL